jgi:aspartyl/asparaginyl beta-hydroxylase (cupin superfamily)
MQLSGQDAERLVREGAAALQAGRPDDARARFETVIDAGGTSVQIWLLLASACRGQGDVAAEEAALDQLLARDPALVRGLIMKADCRLKSGDEQLAAATYRKALQIAAGQTSPQSLVPELDRAEAALAQLKARQAGQIETWLDDQGFAPGQRSPRFQRSLDISAGRRQVFLQAPTGYFYPELPHVQFFDRTQFDWAPALEAATDIIRGELLSALSGGLGDFRPYVRSDANEPRTHPLLDRKDWSALFFCENGTDFPDVIARCPRTWKALQAVPLPRIDRYGPTAMFSLLRPATRIPPHHGTHNTRLICHLPLIVPPGCGFRVGNETREWEIGKLIIFDDTIEHEAWNEGSEDRVVLIFDVWRPELTARERDEITALFSVPQAFAQAGAA